MMVRWRVAQRASVAVAVAGSLLLLPLPPPHWDSRHDGPLTATAPAGIF